jgi:hypothetical protein
LDFKTMLECPVSTNQMRGLARVDGGGEEFGGFRVEFVVGQRQVHEAHGRKHGFGQHAEGTVARAWVVESQQSREEQSDKKQEALE